MLACPVAVLVSGGGTNLQALIDAQANGSLTAGRIALVVSNKPGVFALERASRAGIPTAVLEKKGEQALFEARLGALLEKNHIELIVLAGFLTILSGEFTAKYPNRIINVHPSLIPAFCGVDYYGLRVHQAALDRGVKLTGATVHYVNHIADGGPIIAQKAVEVLEGDTAQTLQKRVMEQAEWVLLPQAAQLACTKIQEDKAL